MQQVIQPVMSKQVVISLTESYVTSRLLQERGKRESFTLPELLGTEWPDECAPFWDLFGNSETAGRQMGKLLGRVAPRVGMTAKKETKHGRPAAITRYYF